LYRAKLRRILIVHEGTAKIDKIEVWDGQNKIVSKLVLVSGNHLALSTATVVDLPEPLMVFGVSISCTS